MVVVFVIIISALVDIVLLVVFKCDMVCESALFVVFKYGVGFGWVLMVGVKYEWGVGYALVVGVKYDWGVGYALVVGASNTIEVLGALLRWRQIRFYTLLALRTGSNPTLYLHFLILFL